MLPESLNNQPAAAAFAAFATHGKFEFGELTIEVAPADILRALRLARDELKLNRLSTVTGVDLYPAEPRFEVVYHLQSVHSKERLRIKARLPGTDPEIESAVPVFRSANWYERETFDLFGIRFLNHPDMRRILMPEDWEGYPLRKDYPVTGTRY
jgi:NADH-quinone oxidoreductase subunit C